MTGIASFGGWTSWGAGLTSTGRKLPKAAASSKAGWTRSRAGAIGLPASTWDHWQEAGQKEVLALYREVDRLAREYEAAKKQGEIRYGADHSFFSDWCVGKLPAPFDRWEEELAAIFQTKKARVVNDPAYAHAFAVSNLLYFIHDLEKDLCPDILIGKRWKE